MSGLCQEIPYFVTKSPHPIHREGLPAEIYAEFVFDNTFSGFQGHFPDRPLLPGIVQIMLARYTAAMGNAARLTGVKRCKFLKPIKPGESISVSVTTGHRANEYQASVSSNAVLCATMQFELAQDGKES